MISSQGIFLNFFSAALAGMAYFWVFRLNQQLDAWTLYAQGISLVFLPAGVKHVAILLGKGWGALGCFAALMWLAFEIWPDISVVQAAIYSGISTAASWAGLCLGLRLLRIREDLGNLRFTHLTQLDLLTTALHGLVVNLYFVAVGFKSDQWLTNALAMMFGDFVGNLVLLIALWAVLLLLSRLKKPAST